MTMNFSVIEFLKKAICALVALFVHTTFTFASNAEMRFVLIRAGEFTMGSSKYENQVEVKLTKDFEMQTTEVTQLQWLEIMGKNPSTFKKEENCRDEHQVIPNGWFRKIKLCPNHPVESVKLNDVRDFIVKLNEQKKNDGYVYRLPTEAEWEYAARAKTTTDYFFGDNPWGSSTHSWNVGNSNARTHKVGQKRPNPWNLYDIYGNVWELVQDYYAEDLPGGTDPLQSVGYGHITRGGSWNVNAKNSSSISRIVAYRLLRYRYTDVGFRLVRVKE